MASPRLLRYAADRAGRASSVLEGLQWIDRELTEAGWPSISPWWWRVLRAFLEGRANRKLRRLIARVGRRGGKSTTMCRLAVALALFGGWPIPPGDHGVVAFVSVKLADARERLATIAQILDALGEPCEASGDEVRLVRLPIVFRAYAASFRTSVGFTCIALFADETARWRDDEGGANPARHVFSSMRPSLATMAGAVEVVVSSPWATLDYHHELCERGTTDEQLFCEAPSWVANPVTMSEARAVELEPDEQTRQREYGGPGEAPPKPMTSDESTFYDAALVDRAAAGMGKVEPGDVLVAGADFGFIRNGCALSVYAIKPDRRRVPILLDQRKPQGGPLKPGVVIGDYGRQLVALGVQAVMADGHYRATADEHLGPLGIAVLDAPNEVERPHVATRVLLAQGLLQLPAELVKDFKETKSRPTQSGRVSIKLPQRGDGSHADGEAATVLALYQEHGHEVVTEVARDDEYERYLERADRDRDEGFGDVSELGFDDGW